MGLLSQGRPLNWEETKKYAKYVQERGIEQFINIYTKSKDRSDSPFKWGDEIEYILVKFDHNEKIARVSLKAEKIFRKIAQRHSTDPQNSLWNPEFAAYMVEGTPATPYGSDDLLLEGICKMEQNMQLRRNEVQALLDKDEVVLSLTNFPRLGCKNMTHPIYQPNPKTSALGSLFFPDEAVFNGHPRFKTIATNIRARRKRKVIINIPIYKDLKTPEPFYEHFDDSEARKAVKPNHVYLDAMGFGMGCCCVQVTLQATHLAECKNLYDQLAPICPIAMALSAASPIYRGYLTDIDCRWQVIAASVDDRTKEESNEVEGLKDSLYKMPKSRYDTLSLYLSKKGQEYNDTTVPINEEYFQTMIARGVEPEVARHVANLFIRDPITLYKEKLEQRDDELDHFENIQSTNWFNMRFKPPPANDSKIGWRVEFRPLEAQTTDFENAAYSAFIILLSRVILAYKLNFLIPISLLDANMKEASKRDAVSNSKFWFRKEIISKSRAKPLSTCFDNSTNSTTFMRGCALGQNSNGANYSSSSTNDTLNSTKPDERCARLMTIDEIINGSPEFVGLIPIINHYVDSLNDGANNQSICKIKRYLKLVSDRASLRAITTAKYIRNFVTNHTAYEFDSVVNDTINYDLLCELDKLGKNNIECPELGICSNVCPVISTLSAQVEEHQDLQPMNCDDSHNNHSKRELRKPANLHSNHTHSSIHHHQQTVSRCHLSGSASKKLSKHGKCKTTLSPQSNSSRSLSR